MGTLKTDDKEKQTVWLTYKLDDAKQLSSGFLCMQKPKGPVQMMMKDSAACMKP